MGRFAAQLARLRQESGFVTPYAFYHRNGGRRVFPFTFAYYLKVERGDSLPRAVWVPRLLALLRIPPTQALHRSFALAYLADSLGEEAYDALVGPYLAPAPAAGPATEQLTKRLMSEQAVHLTAAQASGLAADEAVYWCFECLSNDRAGLTEPELAAATGLGDRALRAGLSRLAALKLAKGRPGGRWKSPLAGRFYTFPRDYPALKRDRERLRALHDAMADRRGADLFTGALLLRAEDGPMRRVAADVAAALETSGAWAVDAGGERTGLYKLEARVRRLTGF
jgi:hypothetical protein